MSKGRTHEARDVSHLRLNDFSLAAFYPYSVEELENFNAAYSEDLERPIIVSMNGFVLHGRKRFEAACLRAHSKKKHVTLACLVDPVRDDRDIYKMTAELMAEDMDHTDSSDRTTARMCLEYGFTKKFKMLRDLIVTATRGGVSTYVAAQRQKIYGSQIVSYEVKRHVEQQHLQPAALVRLIRNAEAEFGGWRVPLLPHRIPAARRYLDSMVEAFIRNEPLPKTASVHAVKKRRGSAAAANKESVASAPAEPAPTSTAPSNLSDLWSRVYTELKTTAFAELSHVDPVLVPVHDERLKAILRRFQSETEKSLENAKKQVYKLRRELRAAQSIRFAPVQPLEQYYESLGIAPIEETTAPEEALEQLRQRFRFVMHVHHPDKGGSHDEATKINVAYEKLTDHWSNKNKRNVS